MRARQSSLVLYAVALLAATTAGGAAQTQTRIYPGWSLAPNPAENDGSEIIFRCAGDECAAKTLQCVSFRRVVTMPDNTQTESLLGENFTWGQFEFWLARRYWEERNDVGAGIEAINNGRRSETPTLKRSGETPYVSVVYETAVRDWQARLPVALWVRGGEIRGLRCSYRIVAGDDPAARIAQLLELVIGQPR
jgi:hypothetical protein